MSASSMVMNWGASAIDECRCCRRLHRQLLLMLQLGCCGEPLLCRRCLGLQLGLPLLQLLLLMMLLSSPFDCVLRGVDGGDDGDGRLLRRLLLWLLLLRWLQDGLLLLLLCIRMLLLSRGVRLRLRQMVKKLYPTSMPCHRIRGVRPRGARATPARVLAHDHLSCFSSARLCDRHWWAP